ncbi:MAG: SMI1/KNR4 family protein [Coprobacillaceae bacterium]
MLISKYDTSNVKENINSFEDKYNFSFPEQYKKFLLKYNGGETPNTKFKMNKISSDIKGFYGLGNAKMNYDFFIRTNTLREYMDKDVLPIASDSFGNDIVIGLSEDNHRIYFSDHELGNKLTLLANDFITFVEKCKSEKINEASTRSIDERAAILIAKGRGHVITDSLKEIWQAEIDKYGSMNQEELNLD